MRILNYLLSTQPEIVKKLEKIGFKPFHVIEDEHDPEFEYYDKLMREVPRP